MYKKPEIPKIITTFEPTHKPAKIISVKESASTLRKPTDFQIKEIWNNHCGERECWNEITEKTDGNSKTIGNHHHKDTNGNVSTTRLNGLHKRGNQCRMERTVIESVSQSVIWSISLWVEWSGTGGKSVWFVCNWFTRSH